MHEREPAEDDDFGGAASGAGEASGAGAAPDGPGDWFGRLGQLDFDIDFFERLLARNPGSIEVLRVLAELASRKGLVNRALELDRRLVELLPGDFLARYNLGCSLARAGRPTEAIDALSRAILLGYDDLAHMESDPDLASLREHPEFRELLGLAEGD
jgi:tetratricopeptide (TPR) repeat protein